jgi:hypothetical protein
VITDINRHERRRQERLRRQGYTDNEIREQTDRPDGDPLLDARGTRKYCGQISEMTLWRWSHEFGFPLPDVVIARRRFWRRSSLDDWIESRRRAA